MKRRISLLALLFSLPAMAIDLQGHRGARGLLPENTLPAFERAIALGVTTLELDVAVTRDGVVVIHHDRTLNPDLARGHDGQWVRARRPPSIRSASPSCSATTSGACGPGPSTPAACRTSRPSMARAFRA